MKLMWTTSMKPMYGGLEALFTVDVLLLMALSVCSALTVNPSRHPSSSNWMPLPHVDIPRRQVLSGGAGLVTSSFLAGTVAYAATDDRRSVASVDSHAVIPVWPSWGGGRVVPISLHSQDPFLLLAHHKHWFDPRDPLRKPFQVNPMVIVSSSCNKECPRLPSRMFHYHTIVVGGKGIGIALCWFGRV